jgi:5'-3' exonuclease
METVLLIDGKNTVYRTLFASRKNREFAKYHPFAVWLRFTHVWLEKFKPDTVHVFWDCPKDEIWRKRVLNEYKAHRGDMPHYDEDVQLELRKMIGAARAVLPYMGVRQYYREHQECDDLIYSACRVLTPPKSNTRKVIIISSDSDFRQLQWSMEHVWLYLPKDQKFAGSSSCDPAIKKALSGDKADNIEGFRGIGPVKSEFLASNPKKLIEFLDLSDIKKFKRNLALIDLSMNPGHLNNEIYVIRKMAQDVEFNKSKINELGIKHKVKGLMSEYARVAIAFKRLK